MIITKYSTAHLLILNLNVNWHTKTPFHYQMVISSFLITDMIVISSAILGHRMTIIQEQWNIKSIPKPKPFSKFGHMVKKEAEKHLLRLYREFNTCPPPDIYCFVPA